MRAQFHFADVTSPNPNDYNGRVFNSNAAGVGRGTSVVTLSGFGAGYGVGDDSQGLFNAEGTPHQVAEAGRPERGFISVYLHGANGVVDRSGNILVPAADLQRRIEGAASQQYRTFISDLGGQSVIDRAHYLLFHPPSSCR